MRPELIRIAVSSGLLSTWLVSLGAGQVFGGAIHLLLLGAVLAAPWRAVVAEHRADLTEVLSENQDEDSAGGPDDQRQQWRVAAAERGEQKPQ